MRTLRSPNDTMPPRLLHFDESEWAVESGDDYQRSTPRAWRDHCEPRLRWVHERGLPHNLDELLRQADGERHIRAGLAPA